MPGRIRPTHELSVTREEQVAGGEDDYGSPTYDDVDVIGGTAGEPVPVRFHVGGVDLSRRSTGETVDRSPAIEAHGGLASTLSEGDVCSLQAIADDHDDYEGLEAHAVIEVYGQHARPKKAIIETEGI